MSNQFVCGDPSFVANNCFFQFFTLMKNIPIIEATGAKCGYFWTFFSYLHVSLNLDLGNNIASLNDISDYFIPLILGRFLSAR